MNRLVKVFFQKRFRGDEIVHVFASSKRYVCSTKTDGVEENFSLTYWDNSQTSKPSSTGSKGNITLWLNGKTAAEALLRRDEYCDVASEPNSCYVLFNEEGQSQLLRMSDYLADETYASQVVEPAKVQATIQATV